MRRRLRTEEIRKPRRRAAAVALGVAAAIVAGTAWTADEPDELMPGKIAIVKPGKLAKFVAKPTSGTFALPGSGNAPTDEGGSLAVFDSIFLGGGANTYPLAAGGWTGLGNPAGSKGYKYKGAGSLTDPCKVVLIKEKVIKGVCKGAGVTVTPPLAGELGILLTAGTDSKRYCASFGGTDVKNQAGLFKRKDAPAPGACPSVPVPVCGNGALEGDEDCDDDNVFNGDGCRSDCTIEACGDNILDPQEQCDDGGTTSGDGCSATCENELGTCSPVIGTRTVTVSISTPEPLAGIQLGLEYPQLQISIPGSGGTALVQSRVQFLATAGLTAVNDLDTDLKVTLADANEVIDSGPVFEVEFDECIDQGQNICNRSQNVIGCCSNDKVCQGDLVTVCTTDGDCAVPGGPCVFDPACMFNPPVCPVANFPPPTMTGICTSPIGGCPADNVCVTQNSNTACDVISPVDSDGQPVAGVTCSVAISSPSGAFLDGEDL